MDQKKIGNFLRDLRKSKEITQEQLAEMLGVSNKTISRWETGTNMPDLSLLIEISKLYEIEIAEILEGEHKVQKESIQPEEIMFKVIEYGQDEKIKLLKDLNRMSVLGVVMMTCYFGLLWIELESTPVMKFLLGLTIGSSLGAMISVAIYTSKHGLKMKQFKKQLIKNIR